VAAPPDEYHAVPAVGDGRPPIADVHRSCDALLGAGWRRLEIAAQVTEAGESLPIVAYLNATRVDRVLIGGIHGREPAGAVALSRYAGRLAELGRTRSILLLPLLNPWGYSRHLRYGPTGQSVSDSDHLLGRSQAPACPEAAAITSFVLDAVQINPGAAVLDLHEDPVYEEPAYRLEGDGSYLYVTGEGAREHPVARRVHRCLEGSVFPLVREGVTRFGERLVDGFIVDTEDGSIDELLARKGRCSPVITTEIVLRGETTPPLAERVSAYLGVLDAFFGL
jgi:predicted deacylase